MRKYRLVAEYSNESIDLNCFGNFAFQPTRRSFSRDVELLYNYDFNFAQNGATPKPIDFGGKIVFKTDSLKTAKERFQKFKTFFGFNTTYNFFNNQNYAFGYEPLQFTYPNPNHKLENDTMVENLVRKVKLISHHEDGEERFAYVFLKQADNISYYGKKAIVVDVVFGLLTPWLKRYSFDMGGASFYQDLVVNIDDFGDVGQVVVGINISPNNYNADRRDSAYDEFSLDASRYLDNPLTIRITNQEIRDYQVHEGGQSSTIIEEWWKGAKIFIGEQFNQYSAVIEKGVYSRFSGNVRTGTTIQNAYKFIRPNSIAKVVATPDSPRVRFESSRPMTITSPAYQKYAGIDGELFYYAKYFED